MEVLFQIVSQQSYVVCLGAVVLFLFCGMVRGHVPIPGLWCGGTVSLLLVRLLPKHCHLFTHNALGSALSATGQEGGSYRAWGHIPALRQDKVTWAGEVVIQPAVLPRSLLPF